MAIRYGLVVQGTSMTAKSTREGLEKTGGPVNNEVLVQKVQSPGSDSRFLLWTTATAITQ
jgi:hypothetical protein